LAFNLEDYETVEDRLLKFWKEYPDGRIETELIEAATNRFIVMARLYKTEADQRYWASGLAFETITDRGVNATNALENCETSAIGRALANCGYATRGKRPSREEMSKASRERIIKVEKPSDPWTTEPKEMPIPVNEAVAALNDGIVPEEIPMCKHGAMTLKEGIGKTNKPYHGYTCNVWSNDQCDPIWYELDKSGRWIPQKPKVQLKELG
jgi:hypothetical protein